MRGCALYNKIYFSRSSLWTLSSHVMSHDIVSQMPQGPVSHWDGLRTIIAPSSIRVDNCLDVAFKQLSVSNHSLRKLILLELFKTFPP